MVPVYKDDHSVDNQGDSDCIDYTAPHCIPQSAFRWHTFLLTYYPITEYGMIGWVSSICYLQSDEFARYYFRKISNCSYIGVSGLLFLRHGARIEGNHFHHLGHKSGKKKSLLALHLVNNRIVMLIGCILFSHQNRRWLPGCLRRARRSWTGSGWRTPSERNSSAFWKPHFHHKVEEWNFWEINLSTSAPIKVMRSHPRRRIRLVAGWEQQGESRYSIVIVL